MGEFFKGWRRKAGLVTLVVACAMAVGWMRSVLNLNDDVFFYPDNTDARYALESSDGNLIFRRDGPSQVDERFVPYWSLVLPLTLISAWLILGKTRKSSSATES